MSASDTRQRPKPEVMSPVGGHEQLRAAVEAGADAVFFGVETFHARAKVGFSNEELPDIMRMLRERGVKGFVTFNTLIFDRELRAAERQLLYLSESGVDAIIVQDIGAARLAREVVPDLALHASTQMSVTSAQGAELARRFGATRVVLGRELSLKDIARIRAATTLELETFVHGALCVSYSGQCFSSEAWGGRSANRGQCAQACRLPYDLFVDGELGDARYLLSPGDLYALRQIPELVRVGVDCFKIEGRYKSPEFVALTTAAYRKAVDEAWAELPLSVTPQEEEDLEQIYSRGLGPHFISGTDHQAVVRGRAPRHRGLRVGTVEGVTARGVLTRLSHDLKAGDGLVFDSANWRAPQGREEGGFLYGGWQNGRPLDELRAGEVIELRFGRGAIDLGQVRAGDWVWRTHDPSLEGRLKPMLEGAEPLRTRPIQMHFVGEVGQLPRLSLSDDEGRRVTVTGEHPLAEAKKRALDEASLREQLGKLGGTPYHLAGLSAELRGAGFLPLSALNALRREAVSALSEARRALPVRRAQAVLEGAIQASAAPASVLAAPRLHLLVRTPEQLRAAIALRPDSITLDYLELYGLKPSVEAVKAAGLRVRVASPRILKPTEQNIQKFLLGLEAEVLIRSGGLLEGLQGAPHPPLSGDLSLNVANALSARALLALGLERFTPTHDLNAQQMSDLARLIGPQSLEVIAYGHLPVFHTEHCVFCRFLSSGTDYTNCGHPCESHAVALRDERGQLHPVMADVGCRNTVFEGRAQSAARHLEDWLAAGLRDFRLEFVHEDEAAVREVTEAHRAYFAGDIGASALAQRLSDLTPTTEGSLFVPPSFGAGLPLPDAFAGLEALPVL